MFCSCYWPFAVLIVYYRFILPTTHGEIKSCVYIYNAEVREYCFPNSFNASCGADAVVVMTSARYGRISSGSRCLSSEYKVGCWADVLQHLDRRCSGRRRCTIAIPDNTMHLLQPCQKDLFAYLEADYVCQKGCHSSRRISSELNWSLR